MFPDQDAKKKAAANKTAGDGEGWTSPRLMAAKGFPVLEEFVSEANSHKKLVIQRCLCARSSAVMGRRLRSVGVF
jgi:hypothetical protein